MVIVRVISIDLLAKERRAVHLREAEPGTEMAQDQERLRTLERLSLIHI